MLNLQELHLNEHLYDFLFLAVFEVLIKVSLLIPYPSGGGVG